MIGVTIVALTNLMSHWGLNSTHIVSHDIGEPIGLRFGVFHPEMTRTLTVINTVSYDSWPSATWQKIIANGLDELTRAPDEEHRKRIAKQLRMVVQDKSIMEGDVLDSYLDAISGPIGQPSFFQPVGNDQFGELRLVAVDHMAEDHCQRAG